MPIVSAYPPLLPRLTANYDQPADHEHNHRTDEETAETGLPIYGSPVSSLRWISWLAQESVVLQPLCRDVLFSLAVDINRGVHGGDLLIGQGF